MEKKHLKEVVVRACLFVAAMASTAAVLIICLFLFGNSLPLLKDVPLKDFLFGTKWAPNNVPPSYGILPMILGSIYVTAGAIVVGVPIGILSSVFMACYCPEKLYKILKPATNLMAGIPSIIYGFFGMVVIVPFVRNTFGGNGNSILSASILLGIMILPTIIGVSESAIRAVPKAYYEGSLAMGATKERSIFKVTLPAAKSGIIAAVVLGIGRAIGETMAVIMVVGNQTRIPTSILQGVRTMTAHIVTEMGYAAGVQRTALLATGVVLFIFILIINFCISAITNKDAKKA